MKLGLDADDEDANGKFEGRSRGKHVDTMTR